MSVTSPAPEAERGDPEALIEEAWQRARQRRRRRWIAAITGLVVVCGGVLACIGLSHSHTARRDPVGRSPALTSGSTTGHYLYTRASFTPPAGYGSSAYAATIENWVGSDGTWRLRETVPGRAPGSIDLIVRGDGLLPPQANAGGALNGAPINQENPGDGLFTARQLNSLPTSVAMLQVRLEQAVTAQELRNLNAYVKPGPDRASELARLRPVFLDRHTADMLTAISALDMSPLPPRLPTALYHVARALPGVHTTVTHDRHGRPGIEVAGQGRALIFDARTGALRSTTAGAVFDQGVAGTIIAQSRVPNAYTIPHGLNPIRSLVGRPPAMTLAPSTGTPTTTFTVRLALAQTRHAAQRAPDLQAAMFGPTGPDCTYWRSQPPAVRIPAGTLTRNHGDALATYRVSPAAIGRSSWCPGRYQLMLTAVRSSPWTGVPRSFTAAYFTTR